MAGLLPQSGTQQFDNATGAFLSGGQLFVYNAGTTTPAAIFSSLTLVPGTELPSPILLDISGRIPEVFAANGYVRVKILNSVGVQQTVLDYVPIITAASGGSSGGTPIPDATQTWSTGDIKVRYDDQPQEGFVRLNGLTMGPEGQGGTERAKNDTQALYTLLWRFADSGGTIVFADAGARGATAATDWAANRNIVLPDCAGRLIGAIDDLGAGPKGRITVATIAGGATKPGSNGGQQSYPLSQAHLPAVNFAVSGTAAAQVINSNVFDTQAVTHTTSDVNVLRAGGNSLAISASSSAVTGTAASGGIGTQVPTMPPVMLFMIYVKL